MKNRPPFGFTDMKRTKTSRGGSSYQVAGGEDRSRDPKPWETVTFTTVPDQNNKRIVLALQSGLKSELTWALNSLTLLSFKEKDDLRRDATPLAKIPGLLDAILQVIDDWRDISLPKDCTKPARVRMLGTNSLITGFGNEYDTRSSIDGLSHSGSGCVLSSIEASTNKSTKRPLEWWFDEDGLFNVNEEGRAEKQQCAVAASNIIRNFSFMPDNETIMAQHRHCLETLFQCIDGGYNTGRHDSEHSGLWRLLVC